MKLVNTQHILDAVEAALVEFYELIDEKEWYVTEVVDHLESAKQILQEELSENPTDSG